MNKKQRAQAFFDATKSAIEPLVALAEFMKKHPEHLDELLPIHDQLGAAWEKLARIGYDEQLGEVDKDYQKTGAARESVKETSTTAKDNRNAARAHYDQAIAAGASEVAARRSTTGRFSCADGTLREWLKPSSRKRDA